MGSWCAASGLAHGAVGIAVAAAMAVVAARRPRRAGAVAILLVSFLGGLWTAAARAPGAPVLAHLAREVPICDLDGWVKEHAGGLGTILLVHQIRCSTRAGALDARGLVVVDGIAGSPGGAVVGQARLVPLGRSAFDGARRRLGAVAALTGADLSFSAPSSPLRRAAARVRSSLVDATRDLDPRRAALLRGLTIGDTSGMAERDTGRLRRSGLSHLVAVSGSNVAIVVGAIAWGLGWLGRTARVLCGAFGLLLYVAIVGPEPSVLRAAAMGGIALAALLYGRRARPLAALGVALIAVILLRPGMLFSVGLHLSAAATAGLVIWGGALAERLRPLPRPVRLVVAATVAAQWAVAPILLVVFGELSIVGPVANVLALPAVPPATVLGMGAGIAGSLSPVAGALLARLAEPFAGWILTVGTVGGHPWAAAILPPAPGWAVAPLVVGAALRTLRRAHLAPGSDNT